MMIQWKYSRLLFAFCISALFLLVLFQTQVARGAGRTVTVASVKDRGVLAGTPKNVIGRDVATTGMLGSQVLWAFGDTFINNLLSNSTPADWRSATNSHADPTSPSTLTEVEDSRGVPYQLIPYTQDELNYNIQKNNAGGDRFALWPTAVLTTDAYNAEVVYEKIHIRGNLNFQMVGIGIAHIAIFQNQATRNFSLDPVSGLTFSGSTIPFGSSGGQMVVGPVTDTVYLSSCTNALADNCFIARAQAPHGSNDSTWLPILANSANYQTWNGKIWVSDLTQAQPAQHLQASAVGWSMAWNSYAKNPVTGQKGAFIGLYNQIVAYGNGSLPTNNVMLVTADSPQGPWTDPTLAFTLTPESGQSDYAVQIHPELTSSDGTTLYVTYAHPAPSKGFLYEDVRVVQIKLQNT